MSNNDKMKKVLGAESESGSVAMTDEDSSRE
jgi:hypothetical protein